MSPTCLVPTVLNISLSACLGLPGLIEKRSKNKYQHTYQSSQRSKQSYPFTSPIFNRKIRWESWYADNHGSLSMLHLHLPSRDIVNSCNSLLQAVQSKTQSHVNLCDDKKKRKKKKKKSHDLLLCLYMCDYFSILAACTSCFLNCFNLIRIELRPPT